MAAVERLPSGKWKPRLRVNGKKVPSPTFKLKSEAQAWATDKQRDRDLGGVVTQMPKGTVGKTIEKYEQELEKKLRWGKTKSFHLGALKRDLGHIMLAKLNKQDVIDYAVRLSNKVRGETILARVSYLAEVLTKAKILWGLHPVIVDRVRNGIAELRILDIVHTGEARERITTTEEIDRIKDASFAGQGPAATVPLAELLHILEVLPLRVGELLKIKWEDMRPETKTVWLRSRKDPNPRKKARNDQQIPLPKIRGRDTWKLLNERPRFGTAGPFDLVGDSVAQAFIRARKRAGIEDLHMHDLRAHAISEMIKAGVKLTTIQQVSGHKNLKVLLKHYHRIHPTAVADEIEAAMAA